MKTIAYITGTRADFGLMTPVLRAIARNPKFRLRLYATGIHLMPKFGGTIREVRKHFPNVRPVRAVFTTDDRQSMALFSGDFLKLLVKIFSAARPDFLLILGDRIEQLTAAFAALYLGIPTGHIHGGERTTTVDDAARHAITMLATLHFPATRESAARIAAMGMPRKTIHVVGAPALDTLRSTKLPTARHEKFILLTLHPISEAYGQAGRQMKSVLAALKTFRLPIVAVYPHADAGGRAMIRVLKQEASALMKVVPSVPYLDFLALERDAAVWVGNSSGMMIESPFFGTPCVNVGPRQRGRQRGDNVIDVWYDSDAIRHAVASALRRGHRRVKNPWGDGHAAERIAKVLEKMP